MFKAKEKPKEIINFKPGEFKPGTIVNLQNGFCQRIKEVRGDEATFTPPENHPAIKDIVGCLNRAAGTGGTWAFLELIRAILFCATYAPEMSVANFLSILNQVIPGILEVVRSRNNARLPFSGEIPFGIPTPAPTQKTVVTRDQNGLITEAEKFSL